MTDFEVYVKYLALKRHFIGHSYDYFKYHGKIRASEKSLRHRKDRNFFLKLSKKLTDTEVEDYIIANLIRNKVWVGDFDQNNWTEHKKINQSLEYFWQEDIEKLLTFSKDFDIIFNSDNGNHPKVIKAYLGKKITLETLVIFEKLLQYRKQFDIEIGETFIWPKVSLLIEKYLPFVDIDNKKFKNLLINKIEEYNSG